MKHIYRYKAGERVHIDSLYSFMGLIPNDAYEQDDPADPNRRTDVDFDDDYITFTKNVTIKFDVEVF